MSCIAIRTRTYPMRYAIHVYVQVLAYQWNPQTRTTTETVQREAMQALVRVQAHMLARIVVQIDPRCRHRCRVGTSPVVYRDVFYADNAHYVVSPLHLAGCLYFKSFLRY